MKLRDYQLDAVQALFDYWMNNTGNPVVAMPTGTGKSLVIAEFIRRAISLYPFTRILVLTHVKELVEQNYEKLMEIWPMAPAGIYSAGLKRKDVGCQVTFGGIGSVAKVAGIFKPDLILIDECHTVSPEQTTTYQRTVAIINEAVPMLKVAGLTATTYRLGQGEIIEEGGLFTDICIDMTTREGFNWFIDQGYLAPLVPPGKPFKTEMDISEVHISKGDYNLKELQAAVDKDAIIRAAVAEMLELGSDRKHWLVFAAGIQHAEHVAAVLAENGITSVCVHSNSGDAFRDEAVKAFKSGQVQALVNNGCFTTGFDFPGIDLIACLRHTISPGLWVQMLGRGTRPVWPNKDGSNWHLWGYSFSYYQGIFPHDLSTREGRLQTIAMVKPNCLVLDFARNTERLGPINDPRKPKSKKKTDTPGDAPAKVCPTCLTYNHASARVCSECGAAFQFFTKVEKMASREELIAASIEAANQEPVQEWFDVDSVQYSKHTPWNGKKRGPFNSVPSSLRVTYNCGLRSFFEYICLEHEGHALTAARQWWTITSNGLTIPPDTTAALKLVDSLKQPEKIRVWVNRPNPKVMHREFLTLPQ